MKSGANVQTFLAALRSISQAKNFNDFREKIKRVS